VLRPKDGEEVELFDGCGTARVYAWSRAEGGLLAARRSAVRLPRPSPLVLFACVTKGSRWDWTIEKATELGATRIVPVISARTIVRIPPAERAAKRGRWMRVAEDAARQSDAAWLPEIAEPVDFADSLPLVEATDCYVGALSNPPPEPLLAALARRSASEGRPLALYVGPEGDFSPEELASLLAVATPASFGPTILRAETAAIFALSVLAAFRHVKP
jgi:16S rRNA (uracil1498-N3)-methyltransferase